MGLLIAEVIFTLNKIMKKSKLLTHDKGYLDCYFLNTESYQHDDLCELDVNENSAGEGAHQYCSPVGPKGETGAVGLDLAKEELQIIINDILADAGEIQVNLTSETGRNFVSKRIIEVLWPK